MHPVADIDHGPRKIGSLIVVERECRAGGQEGGEMDFGVATRGYVTHDFGKGARIEAVTVDAPAHARQRLNGWGVGDGNLVILA